MIGTYSAFSRRQQQRLFRAHPTLAGHVIDKKGRVLRVPSSYASTDAFLRALSGQRPQAGDQHPPRPPAPLTLREAAERRVWTRCRELLQEIGTAEARGLALKTIALGRDCRRDELCRDEYDAMTAAIVAFADAQQAEGFADERSEEFES